MHGYPDASHRPGEGFERTLPGIAWAGGAGENNHVEIEMCQAPTMVF